MTKLLSVDLNCDLGESFGAYRLGNDEAILPYISSANIACGFHAGDPGVMKGTVQLCLNHGVAIGAHPGLPDLAGFGRRNMAISVEEAYDLVVYQIGALSAFTRAQGTRLHHVKPHGALYNMAATDAYLAKAICEAVYKVDPELILYGLAGGELIKAGAALGLRTGQEVFADRSYQPDGTLTPRSQPDALLADPNVVVHQVLQMVEDGKVTCVQGTEVPIKADTICLHGDVAHALSFAQTIRAALERKGIIIKAL